MNTQMSAHLFITGNECENEHPDERALISAQFFNMDDGKDEKDSGQDGDESDDLQGLDGSDDTGSASVAIVAGQVSAELKLSARGR